MARDKTPPIRLAAEDWARAALHALARGGVGAVAVEPLAKALGVTKGSFYWHFPNRHALLVAALTLWERAHTDETIALVEAVDDPAGRLRALFEHVLQPGPDNRVELALLAAADDPLVGPVVARVTERRVAFTAGLFRELGYSPAEARQRGLLAYTAYLGHAQLAHAAPSVLPSGADAGRQVDHVLAALTTSPALGGAAGGGP